MIMHRNTSRTILLSTIAMACSIDCSSASADDARSADYLETVQAFADAMLEHGRDRYGPERTPLFAAALDRKTMSVPRGDARQRLFELPRAEWGIRTHDRMLSGANPMHDQNLYQVLYALAEITSDKRYAHEADKTLEWFFQHCQSPATGLLAWGEHMGWDFFTEKSISDAHEFPEGPMRRALTHTRDIHEFARPWLFLDRCFRLAPQQSAAFARGVLEHQIGDQRTGNFSRHARYSRHAPGRNMQFPRHGGFYIYTWAKAYKQTRDPVFLKAIETLLSYFESRRNPESHAIPKGDERVKGASRYTPCNIVWPGAMGDAIMLLTETYRLTGEKRYLKRAHQLAQKSLATFFPDTSPLPKASSRHNHYESITRADTLVMAILNLWACENGKDLNLIYTDR